jgi:hypothetical protein
MLGLANALKMPEIDPAGFRQRLKEFYAKR